MKLKSAKYPGRIRNRMIVVFLIPTVLLMACSGLYYYMLAKQSLEKEMGRRLQTLAAGSVQAISGEAVTRFIPGDETGRSYQNAREKLRNLRDRADADKIFVFTPSYKFLLHTQDHVTLGSRHERLSADETEIKEVISTGKTVSSPMFPGENGKWFKAGYAPIIEDGKVTALVGVYAGVRFFTVLKSMGRSMTFSAIAGVLGVILLSLFVARGIERPVSKLVESARRIGAGELDHQIAPTTRDEIGFLADTLNEMRRNIVERDRYLQMLQRGIAHEVRNPLGGMGLFCDILSEELGDDEKKIRHVQKIRREVDGLNKVVNDFLDFTREVSLDIRNVDLSSFLSDILMHYSVALEGKKIDIVKRIDDDLSDVRFDPELVRRALFNLINNGIQAMPKGGRLSISAFVKDDMLALQVADTGMGISEEDMENIYTPFYTTKDKGTGLGLPFTKKIAENHGGELEIESNPGQGSKITLLINLAREEIIRS